MDQESSAEVEEHVSLRILLDVNIGAFMFSLISTYKSECSITASVRSCESSVLYICIPSLSKCNKGIAVYNWFVMKNINMHCFRGYTHVLYVYEYTIGQTKMFIHLFQEIL